ncbi:MULTISPECIES: ribonuclease domain-containing protein [Nocardioides]|uniref:Ribonuclease domain-containing protein n=1 Tax=Nocardioides vastitatis TaxID=2568655 RepID=A0ABW0ZFU5_9ACTN|nr:ribonuclease domain-containing protein [Nocardioides sp.]THJ11315.1 ribonuclease [Nocardioides sp.]
MDVSPGRPRLSRRTAQVLSTVALVVVTGLGWWVQSQGSDDEGSGARDGAPTSSTQAEMPAADDDGIPYVALDQLPPEAAETVALIDAGGPFPHPGKDGSIFGNFERRLPDRPRGYYAEYTVPTPGLDHRGSRRVVAGRGGELYWTADHYESFERIWQ